MPTLIKNMAKHSKTLKKILFKDKKRLPPPHLATLNPASTKFAKLQAQWYKKIADDGFKDLEKFNAVTGEPLELMTGSLRGIADSYNTQRETYFRRIRNFVTHRPWWGKTYVVRKIADYHAEGVSYRDMIKMLAKKGHRLSIYKIFYWVKKLEKAAFRWNKTHPEGLDFNADISLRD